MKKYVKPELEVVMFTTESITDQPQYYGYDQGVVSTTENDGAI